MNDEIRDMMDRIRADRHKPAAALALAQLRLAIELRQETIQLEKIELLEGWSKQSRFDLAAEAMELRAREMAIAVATLRRIAKKTRVAAENQSDDEPTFDA